MRLSVQCYTLRSEFEKDVWKTLSAIREIGFNFIELAGTYGWPVRELKTRLDTVGLQVSGSHLGLDALESNLEQVIEDHYTLDCRYLILPWVGEADYAEGWDVLGRRIDAIGERIRDAGLRFAYHNHAFEFADAGGKPGLDVLFENSDREHVLAQLDVGWIKHAGQDPAAYIRHYGARAPLVHLKDFTPEGKDAIAGEGAVDWEDVLAACREAEVEFGAIEMDHPPGEPIDDVRRCARFYLDRGIPF